MAQENPLQGHRRVQGELTKLGFQITRSTVWEILHKAGIDPAPRRIGPTWKQFLALQDKTIITTGCLYVDTALLTRIYVLVFIEHGTRRVHLLGTTTNPDGT